MKTAITTVITAALFALATLAIGRPLDIEAFVVIVFATSMVAWTLEQYGPHRPH